MTPGICRRRHSRLALSIASLALVLATGPARGDYRIWAKADRSEAVEAELVSFDVEEKQVLLRDRDSDVHRWQAADLDQAGKFDLLTSRIFLESFPEGLPPEKFNFLLLAVSVPGGFLLVGFYLSALILTGSFNPLRAFVGWFGSLILGSFLIGIYIFLSLRSPDVATGIMIVGVIVVTSLLSLYVSIIFRFSVLEGFRLLIFHLFVGLFLFLGTVLTAKHLLDPDEVAAFLDKNLFFPVGIIGLL